MKIKVLSITALLCMGLSLNVLAEAKKMVSSQLKEATVFFNGAELTHTATTALQKGDNEIQITGLSPYIDVNSIKIKTTNGALVSAFEFSTDYVSDKSVENPESEKMEATITAYVQELSIIATRSKVNKDMLTVLQKSVIKNVEGSENGLGIADLIKTLDYYKTKSIEIEEQVRLDNEKQKELTLNIGKLKAQLDQVSIKNDKESGILMLNLAVAGAVNTTLTISYYTNYAAWTPYYDITVASTDKPIKITSKAKVRQTTGLDWSKVKLALSTAVPSSGKVAPLFSTWFLSYYTPMHRESKIMMQNAYSYDESVEMNQNMELFESVAPQSPTMDNYVVQTENQLNMTFNIDILYSIPGNGKEQNIELKNQEIPAEFKYYSAPRLNTETFVLAEVKDWQKLNLLSGKANVTYDGTYVGEAMIDASSTNETLSLTLGTDKRVPVKREKEQEYASTKLLGSDITQMFGYKLTVRNNQNVPIKMVLKDQYPKSSTKEITAELLLKETTTPSFNKEDVGVITWEFELKPGETREFKMAYSVKYPKDKKPNLY